VCQLLSRREKKKDGDDMRIKIYFFKKIKKKIHKLLLLMRSRTQTGMLAGRETRERNVRSKVR
jgi:hypothetical protein